MAVKTGIVAATMAIKALCRTLVHFAPAIYAIINAAATSGRITSTQAGTLTAWLNAAQSACDIIRVVSGY